MASRSKNDEITINRTLADGKADRGYTEDFPIGLADLKTSALLTLTAGTTPVIEVSSNVGRITWAATVVNAAGYATKLPGQFAVHARENRLELVADFDRNAVADGAVTLTATIYAKSPDGNKGVFTATATLAASTGTQRLVFRFNDGLDASSNQLAPGDSITMAITPAAHGSDAIYLYGLAWRWNRNSTLTSTTDRSKRSA